MVTCNPNQVDDIVGMLLKALKLSRPSSRFMIT